MDELHCLNCNEELPEDRPGVILTDERGQFPVVLGAWCDEKCLGEWLVKNALDAMMRRMMAPSAN